MIARAIQTARELGKPIGICGQAPSDKPNFAAWLVGQGINSISLNPDSAIRARQYIKAAENEESLPKKAATDEPLLPGEIKTEITAEDIKKYGIPVY
jgi:phosphoenolpyruvate-protein kinase (PTS system EI component)